MAALFDVMIPREVSAPTATVVIIFPIPSAVTIHAEDRAKA